MTLKKLLVILTFLVSVLVITLLGVSYAWYQFDNTLASFNDVKTFNENIDLTVDYKNGDKINNTVGVPILASQVDELANKNLFLFTPKSAAIGTKEAAYQISLIDIVIDNELKNSSYFKYKLVETITGSAPKVITSGNFSKLNGTTLVLKNLNPFPVYDKEYKYEFYLWLEDNNPNKAPNVANQNNLMGKTFTATIRVDAVFK